MIAQTISSHDTRTVLTFPSVFALSQIVCSNLKSFFMYLISHSSLLASLAHYSSDERFAPIIHACKCPVLRNLSSRYHVTHRYYKPPFSSFSCVIACVESAMTSCTSLFPIDVWLVIRDASLRLLLLAIIRYSRCCKPSNSKKIYEQTYFPFLAKT